MSHSSADSGGNIFISCVLSMSSINRCLKQQVSNIQFGNLRDWTNLFFLSNIKSLVLTLRNNPKCLLFIYFWDTFYSTIYSNVNRLILCFYSVILSNVFEWGVSTLLSNSEVSYNYKSTRASITRNAYGNTIRVIKYTYITTKAYNNTIPREYNSRLSNFWPLYFYWLYSH